jgi:hypothetical protein
MDPVTLGRHWKSLAACQITPCLHAVGTAGTFTWNSCLQRGWKTWCVWQVSPCLHTFGTSGHIVHFRGEMNPYMTM